MYRLDHQPSAGDLKLFGASLGLLLCGIGAWVWLRTASPGVAVGLWIAAVLLWGVYYSVPAVQRPLYRGWIVALFPVAWLMSTLVLGILYFGLITPIGLISRLAGRDPLQRRTRRETGWVERSASPVPKSRYYRQH